MRHIVFHDVDLKVNPLEIFNGIIATSGDGHNMVKARIFPYNQFLASIDTPILLSLNELFDG